MQSNQPDSRQPNFQAGQACYLKGYPGNTDPNLAAGEIYALQAYEIISASCVIVVQYRWTLEYSPLMLSSE